MSVVRFMELPGEMRAADILPPPASQRRSAAGAASVASSGRTVGQIMIHDRQRADALAGRGEDRIRYGSADRWRRRFACAAPNLATARYQMDVDLRCLRQTHHAVGIEVAFHRRTVADRDFA